MNYMTCRKPQNYGNYLNAGYRNYVKKIRIDGAIKFEPLWLIPESGSKPVDARRKENKKGSL